MTQAPPAVANYEAMSRAELIKIIETQQTMLQRFLRVLPVSNKVLAPGEKLALAAAAPLLAAETPDQNGFVRLAMDKLAERIGMSTSSASRYVSNLCDRFDASHEVVPYVTAKGQEVKLIYVDPSDPLWTTPPDELRLAPEKERVINGNICPRCGAGHLKVKKHALVIQEVAECEDCGYRRVYPEEQVSVGDEPGEYWPDPKGPQAEEPFFETSMPALESQEVQKVPRLESLFLVEADPSPSILAQKEVETKKGPQPEEPFLATDPDPEKGPQPGDLFSELVAKLKKVQNLQLFTVYTGGVIAALESRRIWVVWRYEIIDGKICKVPYQAHGRSPRKAMVNNASTWGTFADAKRMYEDARTYNYAVQFDGIALMCDGTFTGVDQDHCLVHTHQR